MGQKSGGFYPKVQGVFPISQGGAHQRARSAQDCEPPKNQIVDTGDSKAQDKAFATKKAAAPRPLARQRGLVLSYAVVSGHGTLKRYRMAVNLDT